jgi:hypothetical protein
VLAPSGTEIISPPAQRRAGIATRSSTRRASSRHRLNATVVSTSEAAALQDVFNASETTPAEVLPSERRPLPAHAFWTANAVFNPDTGVAEEYGKLKLGTNAQEWMRGCSKEIGRLAQGSKEVAIGTNTMYFIRPSQKPADRKATYLHIIANYRPQKTDPYRIRFTVGGDRLDYKGPTSTPTAEIATAKILFNSTISTPDARFFTMDLKDFYLGTPMNRFEYMRASLTLESLLLNLCLVIYHLLAALIHLRMLLTTISCRTCMPYSLAMLTLTGP